MDRYGQHAAAGLLSALNAVESYYSDVPPVVGSPDAQGLARVSRIRALLDRGNHLLYDVQLPNGMWPANGDNNREGFALTERATITVAGREIPATRSNSSVLAPAYGHVALRSSPTTSQVNIDFAASGGYHHMPPAILSLQLSAFDRQLLDHFRYERTRLRNRNGFTGGWNTVAINQKSQWPTLVDEDSVPQATQNQGARHPPLPYFSSRTGADYIAKGGNLLFFHEGSQGISAIEVDGYRAYYPWTLPGDYQRFVLHVERDASHPFAIDIFRVKGGTLHEYNLHGSTMMNMDTNSSLGTPLPGVRPLLKAGYGSWITPPWKQGFDPNSPLWYGTYTSVSELPQGEGASAIFQGKCDGTESPPCPVGSQLFDAPSLRIWAATREDNETETETFLAQAPHNFRGVYPDDGHEVDPAAFNAATYITRRRMTNTSSSKDDPAKSTGGSLESLFVHVFEPLESSSAGGEDPAAIASVQQIGLKEDGKGVGLKVTRNDGRKFVVLVRLTPGTDGHASQLPLAQPVLESLVETRDGLYKLGKGAHFGVLEEGSDAVVRIVAGPAATSHVDGTSTRGSGAFVHEGLVTDVASDADGDYLVVTGANLPAGTALSKMWIMVSLGSYRPSSAVQGADVSNDVRVPLQIRSVENTGAGETRVRLGNPLYMELIEDPESSSGARCLVETQRPGRWFCGPQERSFRIVGVATDVSPVPFWAFAPFPSCPSACSSPTTTLTRRVSCQDPVTGCEVDPRACRAGKPADSKVCAKTVGLDSTARGIKAKARDSLTHSFSPRRM